MGQFPHGLPKETLQEERSLRQGPLRETLMGQFSGMYGSNTLLCRAFGPAQAILSISTIVTDNIGLSGAEGPTTDAGISQPP